MSKDLFVVPEDTLRDQARASDPQNSAWVSANAGSGKTHVLAQRVIRLLLQETDASKILCLTYTKAAAANMSNRVFRELARWTALNDLELARQIEKLEGFRPDGKKLRLARQLFARALETPGGLKIQTIHAFCEAVLHQFPLEANIAGHFQLLDGQMETALVAEARRDMLTGAAGGEHPGLAAAFAIVLEMAGEWGLDMLLAEIVQKRDGLRGFIDEIGDGGLDFGPLFEEFNIAPGASADSVLETLWPDSYFDARFAGAIEAAARRAGKKAALTFAGDLMAAGAEADPATRFEMLCKTFLTGGGNKGWKARSTSNLTAKGVGEHFPELTEEYGRFADRLIAASDQIATLRMLEATRAALAIADWLIARYERLKSARGFLDFNDLITRTVRLLARADAGPWVQYKLDKGIDHILVDEAQDTSPDQWSVVRNLAQEFFAGAGARDNVHRTIFAVGDEKQSIYSFQGAEPQAFDINGREFAARTLAANRTFERVPLTRSFRSTEDVLSAVDLVFERETVRKGLTYDPQPIEHKPIRAADAPGYVEIWPSIEPPLVEEPDDWTEAIDHARAPVVTLAERIAQTVQDWIGRGEIIEGTGKRLTAGDVMVLVRKRDRFIHALTRSLKNRRIPVAGADRLSLQAHIAVRDLIALGRFVLQPDDDLSLAALLRSPVFGIGEETLFELSWNRGKLSLFESLRRQAAGDAAVDTVAKQLLTWRAEADFRPVFEFYAAILSRDGVRAKMIARLGHQAGEILDEFLNFCLAEERAGQPGLEAFLATLENAGPVIKREMDQTRNEVRIMTVHAAKGLEAPVVFLVDSGSAPFSPAHLPRLMPFEPKNGGWAETGYLWRVGSDAANGFSREIERRLTEKGEEEYRRLLYVGMTRAEDRLIVCGYHGKLGQHQAAWHALVRDALLASPDCEEREHVSGGFTCHRYRRNKSAGKAEKRDEEGTSVAAPAFPEHLRERLAAAPVLPRPLSPSGASVMIESPYEAAPSLRSPVLDPEQPSLAIQRGLAVHKLLQVLPGLAERDREAAAQRYLARTCGGWEEVERRRAWDSVAAVLSDPRFAPVFAEGSRAEIAVMGTVRLGTREHAISGKIDRLAVTPESVLIADYKTNRPAPASLSEVPEAYVAQLALYRALLSPLYPDRPIRAALLFTEAPRLIELPEKLMDTALARLTPE